MAEDKGGFARLTSQSWWPTAKKGLTVVFFVAVLGLVANHARTVDWPAVWDSMRSMPVRALLIAGALAATSYALYSTYDLLGRHETGHGAPVAQVVGVSFVCYAFNVNLGALVGGVALRYRLYGRLGLQADVVTRVLVLSWLTNWLGYLALAGVVFTFSPIALPPDWEIGSAGLRVVGAGLLVAAAVYIGACFIARGREWQLRGHTVRLPGGRVALMQLAVSVLNWSVIAATVWTLLQHRVDYPTVLSVLLVAAVAGVIAHVPAGLGVLEAVFVALLAHRLPKAELIGALLAYRAIYYLVPLAFAIVLYLVLEARAGKDPDARPGGENVGRKAAA